MHQHLRRVSSLTGLLELLTGLPFAACPQMEGLKKISALMPHGDFYGKNLGVEMEDEVSGRLTLALTMLTVDAGSLDGEFDSRVPVCGNDDNVLKVIQAKMKENGAVLLMKP